MDRNSERKGSHTPFPFAKRLENVCFSGVKCREVVVTDNVTEWVVGKCDFEGERCVLGIETP